MSPGHAKSRIAASTLARAAITLAIYAVLFVSALAHAQDTAAQPATQEADQAPQTSGQSESQAESPADDPVESMFPRIRNTRFWLSGQANFIFQAHPPFHAPYSGMNSMSPNYEKATSRVLTLYTGVRLNQSTELIVDIEEAGGAALSTGLGLAGAPDLDIVRNPLLSKAPYLARGIIHKVFALSKDKVENQRSFLSLFDELPRRVEIRFGKFSMVDFFDQNSVGSDTHFQFANWTVDNNGAYDYAADTRGYTVGALAEFQDRNWGFRFAEALMPKVANGIDLVWRPWQVHAENFEYELRRGLLPGKPGIVRLLAYTNYANMGIYRDAVAAFEKHLVPAPDITDHPWHITRKYGFGINVEQNLARNLTAFARFGWDNGKTESFAYTEVDQTFTGGLGAKWRDLASPPRSSWLSSGDQCHFKGSPELSRPRRLRISHRRWRAELRARKHRRDLLHRPRLARDLRRPGLQHVTNPGYNRDRGPVLIASFRLHLEF